MMMAGGVEYCFCSLNSISRFISFLRLFLLVEILAKINQAKMIILLRHREHASRFFFEGFDSVFLTTDIFTIHSFAISVRHLSCHMVAGGKEKEAKRA